MNNNGVTNTTQQPTQPTTLTPMEGVKIAPPIEAPVNASNQATATSTPQTTPSIPNQHPVVNNQPTIIQTAPVNEVPQQPIPPVAPPPSTNNIEPQPPEKKKKSITPFLIIIIIGLTFYIVYSSRTHKAQIDSLNYNCTPISASKEDKKIDINSTLVQDLYKKVETNIREDLAQPEFNDNMKLYLAYRQILETEKYDSNCNLFDPIAMEPYTCEVSTNFRPKAFKEETLALAIKKLFGEKTTIPYSNIRLGQNSCIGGYEYIPARGEFVEGYCPQNTATSYKVTKTLKNATSNRNTIILTEEVKYHENEKLSLPEYLKSGTYYYTFRLDMNYNYVFVSKTYEEKY